ncbi:hypothetical protein [Nonomuraea longicatena]|uniref:Htaa domain-containing protein n=1 Tax=Nonomuraea longicatena TaxID=83682 RepID=A0ABP3Z2B3_9ACTN
MRRLLLLAAALVVATGPPASAATGEGAATANRTTSGGWAATYLDRLPERVKPGVAYTVGFWVLQHGVRPVGGEIRKTGLRLRDTRGRVLAFTGTRLPEAGHFAATIVVPEGRWRVEGAQGWFPVHAVGTLTVPGALVPVPRTVVAKGYGDKPYWGAARPPGFPADFPKGSAAVRIPDPGRTLVSDSDAGAPASGQGAAVDGASAGAAPSASSAAAAPAPGAWRS